MKIAIASGKGGTGKTTIATSLAHTLAKEEKTNVLFLDCDVEEPNGHLFLRPVLESREEVSVPIPVVNEGKCTYCGRCAEVCQYHAIAVVGKKVLVFREICHGCGSCALNCPVEAIAERPHPIGVIEWGRSGEIAFAHGILNVGEPMASPIIRHLKKRFLKGDFTGVAILDAPPGTSCPVVETLEGTDFALLVTEPTPFGLHDLELAVQVARELSLPIGVVINRDGIGDEGVERFCQENAIPVLMRIPFQREIAEAYATGKTLVEAFPEYRERFKTLFSQIASILQTRAEISGERR